MSKTVRLEVRLTKDQRINLETMAEEYHQNASEFVRDLIDQRWRFSEGRLYGPFPNERVTSGAR